MSGTPYQKTMEAEPKEPTKESQMFLNPELRLTIAHDRQRDMIAAAESGSTLFAARRHRARRGKVADRDSGALTSGLRRFVADARAAWRDPTIPRPPHAFGTIPSAEGPEPPNWTGLTR
jgi:hypothetical protein